MGERNLFVANTPLIVMQAAAAARSQRTRAQLVLLDDFDLAAQLAAMLRRWRDNPFEHILRLTGRNDEHRRGAGRQRGLSTFAHKIQVKRDIRRESLAALRELDMRFEPDAVWVGNDRIVETQYALHLASQRAGGRAGRYLDDGMHTYLGRFRQRPLVRRIDEFAKRIGYGRWAKHVPLSGTSHWIEHSWMAFPDEALDQSPERVRHALPREWYLGRDFLRLSALAAREFGVDRRALRDCSAVIVLPHSNLLRGNAALLQMLRRLTEAAEACGRRVALKYHPREREADPAGVLADSRALVLPKAVPMELLLPSLAPGALLVGEQSTAVLAARWLRPDLEVRDLGTARGDYAARARELLARHGIGVIDEAALALCGGTAAPARARAGAAAARV